MKSIRNLIRPVHHPISTKTKKPLIIGVFGNFWRSRARQRCTASLSELVRRINSIDPIFELTNASKPFRETKLDFCFLKRAQTSLARPIKQKTRQRRVFMRSRADSNRCSSFCRAEPSHSATGPLNLRS